MICRFFAQWIEPLFSWSQTYRKFMGGKWLKIRAVYSMRTGNSYAPSWYEQWEREAFSRFNEYSSQVISTEDWTE
jgi:hypothetical protein